MQRCAEREATSTSEATQIIGIIKTTESGDLTKGSDRLLLEGGEIKIPDALLDSVLTLMPMPTETQDFILDFSVGEIYKEMNKQ